jgi:hypothetical protein
VLEVVEVPSLRWLLEDFLDERQEIVQRTNGRQRWRFLAAERATRCAEKKSGFDDAER